MSTRVAAAAAAAAMLHLMIGVGLSASGFELRSTAALVAAARKTATAAATRRIMPQPRTRSFAPACSFRHSAALRSQSSRGGDHHRHRRRRPFPALEYRDGSLITSPQSKTIKAIQSLLNRRRKRTELGETVVEGPRAILDLLRNPRTRQLVRLIVVSEERRDEYQPLLLDCLAAAESHDVEVEGILGNEANVQVLVATTEVMRSCTDTVTNQGMVALVRIPTAADIDERQEPGLNTASSLHVVLDGLQDPGNVGTLVRSCVATGVAWLWVLPPSADVWGPKALRSAMGLTFALPVQTHIASFQECVEFLCRDFGCRRIYAATMEDSVAMQSSSSESSNTPVSVPHYQVNWAEETGAAALVIGGEGSGLSDEVRQALRDRPDLVRAVHVPMLAGVESLNAGVCGSVILFEYLRQHQQRIHHQQPSLSVPITAHELSPTPSGESQ